MITDEDLFLVECDKSSENVGCLIRVSLQCIPRFDAECGGITALSSPIDRIRALVQSSDEISFYSPLIPPVITSDALTHIPDV